MKVDTVASDPQSYRNMPSAGPAQNTSVPSDEHAHGAPARMGWARLLKRLFDLDLEHCPQCGGDMKIIAAIEEPEVIAKILMHLCLPARAPPRSPARRPVFFRRPDSRRQERLCSGADNPARPVLVWRGGAACIQVRQSGLFRGESSLRAGSHCQRPRD